MSLTYALITPARNEEANVEGVIRSVLAQSVPPLKWIIVSDGSTDRTDQIVEAYSRSCEFIELTRLPGARDRNFAAKVACFNAGYDLLNGIDYDIIGNLDADITFAPDYFEYLLARFAENPKLGVGGTPFIENGQQYDYRFTNIEHVSGACQLFRRKCFEDIGGYRPIRGGGIDWVAVTTARMRGWQTRTFTGTSCFHHRKIGTGDAGSLFVHFKQGQKDYALGNHPLWQAFRAAYQLAQKPYGIRGLLLLSGYMWSSATGKERHIPADLMGFVRGEQLRRLKQLLGSNEAKNVL
jgi:cellulose synthase/poly-beta-1,6-N-acetylglucosamine synthase-like glycosyltransferase